MEQKEKPVGVEIINPLNIKLELTQDEIDWWVSYEGSHLPYLQRRLQNKPANPNLFRTDVPLSHTEYEIAQVVDSDKTGAIKFMEKLGLESYNWQFRHPPKTYVIEPFSTRTTSISAINVFGTRASGKSSAKEALLSMIADNPSFDNSIVVVGEDPYYLTRPIVQKLRHLQMDLASAFQHTGTLDLPVLQYWLNLSQQPPPDINLRDELQLQVEIATLNLFYFIRTAFVLKQIARYYQGQKQVFGIVERGYPDSVAMFRGRLKILSEKDNFLPTTTHTLHPDIWDYDSALRRLDSLTANTQLNHLMLLTTPETSLFRRNDDGDLTPAELKENADFILEANLNQLALINYLWENGSQYSGWELMSTERVRSRETVIAACFDSLYD